jgi:hypothetical protein
VLDAVPIRSPGIPHSSPSFDGDDSFWRKQPVNQFFLCFLVNSLMKQLSSKAKGIIRGAIMGAFIGSILFAKTSSLVWNCLIIAISTALYGLIGYLGAQYSHQSNKGNLLETTRSEIIQFSLLRLLLATAMVAVIFGVMRYRFDYRKPVEIIATSMIAFALGGIVLVSKKRDLYDILKMILLLIGMGIVFVIIACITHYAARR